MTRAIFASLGVRGLAFALAFLLILAATDSEAQKKKPSISKLKGSLRSVKNKRGAITKELKATKAKVRAVKGDINEIDGRLTKLEGELEYTRNRLQSSRQLQVQVGKELIAATDKLEKTREQVQKRLRWMYMRENHSVADTLIGSESLGQFASRGFLLQRIAHADRDLFEDFKSAQRSVASKKIRADQLVREIGQLKSNQESQQYNLNETKEDKKYALGQLKDKQADLEKLVRQLDAEEASIQARIAAYYRSQGGKPTIPKFTGRFGRPGTGRITSGYGMRFHPILHRNRMHTGVDFSGRSGNAIFAAGDGIVISASYSGGYGNMVLIDHGGGISTLYGHCSSMAVGSGQKVKRGQRIATIGSTGLSTAPHLHFEVRKNGRPVNPMGYL